jgi:hypothetical protein
VIAEGFCDPSLNLRHKGLMTCMFLSNIGKVCRNVL